MSADPITSNPFHTYKIILIKNHTYKIILIKNADLKFKFHCINVQFYMNKS